MDEHAPPNVVPDVLLLSQAELRLNRSRFSLTSLRGSREGPEVEPEKP